MARAAVLRSTMVGREQFGKGQGLGHQAARGVDGCVVGNRSVSPRC